MPLALKHATVVKLLLMVSISAAYGADKDAGVTFRPGPVDSYAHRQSSEHVTVAAEEFETDEQARAAFGKHNPYKYGVLPVLLVVKNDTGKALRLDHLRAVYVMPDNTRIESTPAGELHSLHGARQPKVVNSPLPGSGARTSRGKQPLSQWEIEGRAFAARGLEWRSMPPIVIEPESGSSRPSMALRVVVLPAPFGPRSPKTSPSSTLKLTPRTAWCPAYDFCRSTTSMAG